MKREYTEFLRISPAEEFIKINICISIINKYKMESSAPFDTINMTELDLVCESALRSGKHLLLFDKTSRVELYFHMKATMVEFHKEINKCISGG